MAISAGDATTISTFLKLRAGAAPGSDNTNCVALWIRSRWGGSGSDAAIIAAYGERTRDVDLVKWASDIRLHHGGIS
jgi:hypothetical protein